MKFATAHTRVRASRFALVLLGSLLVACARERSAEDEVRDVIAAMEAAAEARDVGDVMEFVATDFSADTEMTRDEFRNLVRAYFVANPKVELAVRIRSIEFPVEDLARVELSVTSLTRGGTTAVGGLDVDLESARVEFVREGDRWRVRYVDRNAADR